MKKSLQKKFDDFSNRFSGLVCAIFDDKAILFPKYFICNGKKNLTPYLYSAIHKLRNQIKTPMDIKLPFKFKIFTEDEMIALCFWFASWNDDNVPLKGFDTSF